MVIFEWESALGAHCFEFLVRFRVLLLGFLGTVRGEMFQQGAFVLEARGFGALCSEVSSTVTGVTALYVVGGFGGLEVWEGHSGTECGSRDRSGGRRGCGFLWLRDPRLIGSMLSEEGSFNLVSKPAGFHSGQELFNILLLDLVRFL